MTEEYRGAKSVCKCGHLGDGPASAHAGWVNLTPHPINIVDGPTIPPSGEAARVTVTREQVDAIDGIPIYSSTYGEVEGLPAPAAGVRYIVSGLVRSAVPNRADVYSPGELVRDDAGRVVGCRGLTQ